MDAQADWERDAHGNPTMGYRQFFDAFFELADIWCPDIDGGQYANFLDTLRTRLSVMVVTKKDGSIVRKLVRPTRCLCMCIVLYCYVACSGGAGAAVVVSGRV